MASAGMSPAAGDAFFLCIGASASSCLYLGWDGVGEKEPQTAGGQTSTEAQASNERRRRLGFVSSLLVAAAERQSVLIFKRVSSPLDCGSSCVTLCIPIDQEAYKYISTRLPSVHGDAYLSSVHM